LSTKEKKHNSLDYASHSHYFSALPSILTAPSRTIIGSLSPAKKVYGYKGKTSEFCDFKATGRVSRIKHELSHLYYFVCVTCPCIKPTNDALQKSHAALRCTDHKIVIVQRSAQDQFLLWLENDPIHSRQRAKFFINDLQLLCCTK